MPLFNILNVNEYCKIAVWDMQEEERELQGLCSKNFDAELKNIGSETRRKEWLCVRMLLHDVLHEKSNLLYHSTGKPYLANHSAHLSISHSQNFVAVMLHTKHKVSVDIEVPGEKLLRLAPKFLSQAELTHANNDLRTTCVYWSSKEVMYKFYEKKGLIFIDNLMVAPFDLSVETQINGVIQKDQLTISCKITANIVPEYCLTYCMDDAV